MPAATNNPADDNPNRSNQEATVKSSNRLDEAGREPSISEPRLDDSDKSYEPDGSDQSYDPDTIVVSHPRDLSQLLAPHPLANGVKVNKNGRQRALCKRTPRKAAKQRHSSSQSLETRRTRRSARKNASKTTERLIQSPPLSGPAPSSKSNQHNGLSYADVANGHCSEVGQSQQVSHSVPPTGIPFASLMNPADASSNMAPPAGNHFPSANIPVVATGNFLALGGHSIPQASGYQSQVPNSHMAAPYQSQQSFAPHRPHQPVYGWQQNPVPFGTCIPPNGWQQNSMSSGSHRPPYGFEQPNVPAGTHPPPHEWRQAAVPPGGPFPLDPWQQLYAPPGAYYQPPQLHVPMAPAGTHQPLNQGHPPVPPPGAHQPLNQGQPPVVPPSSHQPLHQQEETHAQHVAYPAPSGWQQPFTHPGGNQSQHQMQQPHAPPAGHPMPHQWQQLPLPEPTRQHSDHDVEEKFGYPRRFQVSEPLQDDVPSFYSESQDAYRSQIDHLRGPHTAHSTSPVSRVEVHPPVAVHTKFDPSRPKTPSIEPRIMIVQVDNQGSPLARHKTQESNTALSAETNLQIKNTYHTQSISHLGPAMRFWDSRAVGKISPTLSSQNVTIIGTPFPEFRSSTELFIPRYSQRNIQKDDLHGSVESQSASSNLDICETWKGLSHRIAEELLFCERALRQTLEEMVQPTLQIFARFQSDKKRQISLDMADLIVGTVERLGQQGITCLRSALSREGLVETVSRLANVHGCFEQTPGGQSPDARINARVFNLRENQVSGRDQRIGASLMWYPPTMDFVNFSGLALEGHIYYLQPVIDLKSLQFLDFEDKDIAMSYKTDCFWLTFNSEAGLFEGIVPRSGSLSTPKKTETLSHNVWLPIVVTAVICRRFTETVWYEQVLRSKVEILVMSGAPEALDGETVNGYAHLSSYPPDGDCCKPYTFPQRTRCSQSIPHSKSQISKTLTPKSADRISHFAELANAGKRGEDFLRQVSVWNQIYGREGSMPNSSQQPSQVRMAQTAPMWLSNPYNALPRCEGDPENITRGYAPEYHWSPILSRPALHVTRGKSRRPLLCPSIVLHGQCGPGCQARPQAAEQIQLVEQSDMLKNQAEAKPVDAQIQPMRPSDASSNITAFRLPSPAEDITETPGPEESYPSPESQPDSTVLHVEAEDTDDLVEDAEDSNEEMSPIADFENRFASLKGRNNMDDWRDREMSGSLSTRVQGGGSVPVSVVRRVSSRPAGGLTVPAMRATRQIDNVWSLLDSVRDRNWMAQYPHSEQGDLNHGRKYQAETVAKENKEEELVEDLTVSPRRIQDATNKALSTAISAAAHDGVTDPRDVVQIRKQVLQLELQKLRQEGCLPEGVEAGVGGVKGRPRFRDSSDWGDIFFDEDDSEDEDEEDEAGVDIKGEREEGAGVVVAGFRFW